MAAELLTLIVVIESVKLVLRRGRHGGKRERAQCTMKLRIARNESELAICWLYGVTFQLCVDQVPMDVRVSAA